MTLPDGIFPTPFPIAISISPNPAGTSAVVRFTGNTKQSNGHFTITLYDFLGREIRRIDVSASQTEIRLDLRGLPDGQYLVRMTDCTSHSLSAKLVKLTK